jgi:hypothetical protein
MKSPRKRVRHFDARESIPLRISFALSVSNSRASLAEKVLLVTDNLPVTKPEARVTRAMLPLAIHWVPGGSVECRTSAAGASPWGFRFTP